MLTRLLMGLPKFSKSLSGDRFGTSLGAPKSAEVNQSDGVRPIDWKPSSDFSTSGPEVGAVMGSTWRDIGGYSLWMTCGRPGQHLNKHLACCTPLVCRSAGQRWSLSPRVRAGMEAARENRADVYELSVVCGFALDPSAWPR